MPEAPLPPPDAQCPWLLQRIAELQGELAREAEPARRRHWRAQLHALHQRARGLGCFHAAAGGPDATTPEEAPCPPRRSC